MRFWILKKQHGVWWRVDGRDATLPKAEIIDRIYHHNLHLL